MGEPADRLQHVRVRVTSPNGAVSAELLAGSEFRLSFSRNYCHRTAERELEEQCAQLCRLMWVAQTREVERIIADSGGQALAAAGSRDLEYLRRRGEIVAEGRSSDGRVEVTASQGMRHWTVSIRDGTLRALAEDEFIARAAEAAAAVIRDQTDKVILLKRRAYRP